jgi:hypothetical protein
MNRIEGTQKEREKLAFTLGLLDGLAEQDVAPHIMIQKALEIMVFGNINPQQMLDYMKSTK